MESSQSTQKKKFDAKNFLKGNLKLIILGIIAMILFNKYIILIALIFFFTFIGVLTQKVSRIVPHINIETITASAILMGYLYGWKLGVAFAFFVGIYSYIQVSLIKLTSLTNVLLMALCAVLGDLFKSLGFTFYIAFIITMVIRMNVGFFVFCQINPDVFENIMHGYVEGLFHIFITLQLMQLIYMLVSPFV